MKKTGMTVAVACFVLMFSTPALLYGGHSKWKGYKSNYGRIVKGVVECDTQEPVSRALVYIVGESYTARTDDEGKFRLRDVRPGNYELEIEGPDNILTTIAVEVSRKRKTDLGIINIECSAPTLPPEPSSCITSNDCAAGEYCEKTETGCEAGGTCVQDLLSCPQIVAEVCGCDGITYTNGCLARKAGASVLYPAPCQRG